MAGRWGAALSTLHSQLTAAEEAVTIDMTTQAKSLSQLQSLAEQHHSVLAVPPGKSVLGTLRRWMSPVVFHEPEIEARYQAWDVTASTPTLKACQSLLGFLLASLYVNQLSIGRLSPFFITVYVVMTGNWLIAMVLSWHRRRVRHSTHIISCLNTINGVLIYVSTMMCTSSAVTQSAQCRFLDTGMFNTTHVLTAFSFILLHSIMLQVPHLVLHMAVLYIVWWVEFIAYFPALLGHIVLVPFSMCMLLGVMASQVYARQVLSRLQFHVVAELSEQVRANREAMSALDEAHKETISERIRAVRAVTIRDVNESIMGYVCHQLRNPLHALQASIERMRASWLEGATITAYVFVAMLKGCFQLTRGVNSADHDTLDMIDRSTIQLAKVADDVWDFQELQRGVTKLHPSPVRISKLISDATAPFSADGHVIVTSIGTDVPDTVPLDATRASQMLTIGLSNAVKHKKPATAVRLDCTKTISGMLQFEISNEGEGLGTLDVQRAFEPYHVSPEDPEPGEALDTSHSLGLGLPISKQLANLFDGDVGLADRGKMTVFWFTLSLSDELRSQITASECSSITAMQQGDVNHSGGILRLTLPGQPLPVHAPGFAIVPELRMDKPWTFWGQKSIPTEPLRPTLNILVVDDLKSNRLLLAAMLTRQGHVVSQLEDGDEVLEFLNSFTEPIDVLMLDIHMVRTDGRDVMRFLREQGYRFVTVAVTGNISASDIQSYHAAGFDGVLGKPFTSQHVAALIASSRMTSLLECPLECPVESRTPITRAAVAIDSC